jgi:molybdopterin-guanine dinucleotide biosynthesis protein A
MSASTFALRPSTVAAAARQASDGMKQPLKLKYPEKVKRALKAHAAKKGLTVAAYFLQLAEADGLQVDE